MLPELTRIINLSGQIDLIINGYTRKFMSFHDKAIELLTLISSFEEQLKYEKLVPLANVPAELVCMWFDDFYHLTEEFIKDFSSKELNALSAFNAFYDEKLPSLLELENELNEFHNSIVWREVSEEAKKTLNVLKGV
jgi:hypothetical protein